MGYGFRGIEFIIERSVVTSSRLAAGAEAHRSFSRTKQRERAN